MCDSTFTLKSMTQVFATFLLVGVVLSMGTPVAQAQGRDVPTPILARILQLEDERDLSSGEIIRLLADRRPDVRERAALALGRIGDKSAIGALQESLKLDAAEAVRLMSAFALGEIEDPASIEALLAALDRPGETVAVRSRVIEALGKLGGLAAAESSLAERLSQRIQREMPAPEATMTGAARLMTLLSMTALMRLRSPSSVGPLSQQLKSSDVELRAHAANAIVRLRRPTSADLPHLLLIAGDADPSVRAFAGAGLGLTGDRSALEPLLKLLGDGDDRVRTGAVRGLGSLGDNRGVGPLIATGEQLLETSVGSQLTGTNLLLEIATSLGRLKDLSAVPLLVRLRRATSVGANAEVEIALARLSPTEFFEPLKTLESLRWLQVTNVCQGLSEVDSERSRSMLRALIEAADGGKIDIRIVPPILRAMKRVKYEGLTELLQKRLLSSDPAVRAAAAELLSDARDEATLKGLVAALELSRTDKDNDARLSIVRVLAGFKSEKAIEALRVALRDRNYLVRKRALEALWKLGDDRGRMKAEPVGTLRPRAFYDGVARRSHRPVWAVIETDKGKITIELFAREAPLTVENFLALARSRYFDGLTFHRVVSNFVIQGGDPNGDGSGGPGHEIRCEINLRPYVRGTVGMALSGKDTGGSQFFVTHSGQPHLDGGYTVFGQVSEGMDVVDRVVRGDVIRRVTIRTRNRRG